MSWIELDDAILEHPKFVRAIRRGGGDVVWMWLGLRAHCAKLLTDGRIEIDLLDEVKGPRGKARDAALKILFDEKLIEHREGYGNDVWMHDYLDWARSRKDVLESRRKARERKTRSRGTSQRDSTSDEQRDGRQSSDGVTNPRGRDPLPPPNSPSHSTPDLGGLDEIPIRMTADWRPPPETTAALTLAAIPDWAHGPLAAKYALGWSAKPLKQTPREWVERFCWWAPGEWQKGLLKKPTATGDTEDAREASLAV